MSGVDQPGPVLMRAIVVERFGGPEQLSLRQVERPSPGDGQVLVEVAAAGVNPVDTSNRADGSWARLVPPYIPGSDGSGVIAAVGPGVGDFVVGDQVFYFSDFVAASGGSYAEF